MRSSFRTLSKTNEKLSIGIDTEYTENQYKSKRNSFICPCNGRITSHFGKRTDPVFEGTAIHYGIDIAGPLGSSIHCVLDGTVIFAGEKSRWGNVVIVDHNHDGYKTIYAHLHKIIVKEGEILLTGQTIGYRGNTGKSTGPHLHYEVRQYGKALNPLPYLLPQDAIVD
jgi:murein DD-endopeptidase MepM/ murein hydrolase activator NlpD